MAVTMFSDEPSGTGANGSSKSASKKAMPCSAAARRFLLRLDNGSLICDEAKLCNSSKRGGKGGVVLLEPDELVDIGRVKHDDLLRAYRCLVDLRPKPVENTNVQVASSAPNGPATKRPRTDGVHEFQTPFSPLSPGLSSDLPPPSGWVARCRDMLRSVREHLGKSLDIFNSPVDPMVVPDYYKVVKTPMDLGTVEEKLERNQYSRPAEYAADVRQVWYNCKLYNKKGDFVEKTGTGASLHFEHLWASSGLAETKDRSRRANAGLAATKFEPIEVLEKKSKSKGSALAGKGGKRASKGTASSKKVKKAPMSRDQMAALAERLSEMDEDGLQPVVSIIKERNQLEMGPDEEIELDIEALDNETLWALDTYLKNIDGAVPPTSGVAWGGAGADSATESDSSTDSDSD